MKFQNFNKQAVLAEMLNFEIRVELEQEALKGVVATHHQVYKWKRLNSFPLDFVIRNNSELLAKVTHLKSGTGSAYSRVKLPSAFDEKFAYILGAMRDGSLSQSCGKYFVRIYDVAGSQWLTVVKRLFSEVFEIELHERKHSTLNEAYIEITSKPLLLLLKSVAENGLHDDAPEIVKSASIDIKKAYIAGFFDAEGHVPHESVKTKKFRIDFTQKNQDALQFVKQTLEELDIRCGKISTHRLPLFGKENLSRFQSTIMLLNSEKSERFNLLLRS